MDRGAARSRKRQKAAEKAAAEASSSRLGQLLEATADRPVKGGGKGSRAPKDGKDGKDGKDDDGKGDEKRQRQRKKPFDPSDKSQYRPKAIRASHALIYSADAFDIPPPPERLEGVTRVDLEGSGCTDVSWLRGTGITWLSLKGCPVTEGWDAVGSLQGLAVLNISGCGLTRLPDALSALNNLKAIVAMNNEWTALDEAVVGGWAQLNSMIVSHSPNLTSLPASLAALPHLAKLTISHCAKLTAAGLPDLSPLPLLRDVRANNIPRLASLPSHIATWGTGNLALAGKTKEGDVQRNGDGLEVLDLGNCALPLSAISKLFALSLPPGGKPASMWAHLRSITLQANPLTLEEDKYADLLQASPALPRLQIIDSRRVVERKNAGAVPESKAERRARERREQKMRPTGANTNASAGKMRAWGGDGEGGGERPTVEMGEKKRKRRDEDDELRTAIKSSKHERKERERERDGKVRSKRERNDERQDKAPKKRKERYFDLADANEDEPVAAAELDAPSVGKPTPADSAPAPAASEGSGSAAKKRKRKHGKSGKLDGAEAAESVPARAPAAAPAAVPTAKQADPKDRTERPRNDRAVHGKEKDSKSKDGKKRPPSRSETAVVGVVEVAKPKAGGVDLKSVFTKESESGLGVGGW